MNWLDLGWPLLMWSILAALGGVVWLAVWWGAPGTRRRLLLLPRERFVAWNGFDVLAALLVSQIVPYIVYQLIRLGEVESAPENAAAIPGVVLLLVQALSLPVQVGLIVWGLWMSRGVAPARLGLTCRHWAPNLGAGYLVWLAVTPVVLTLYFVLLQFIPEPEHPFSRLEIPAVWPLLLFGVAVAAPLVEELIFRGVLLPWTLNAPLEQQCVVAGGALVMAFLNGSNKGGFDPSPVDFVLVMLPGILLVPYLALRRRPRHNEELSAWPSGEQSEAMRAGPPPVAPEEPAAEPSLWVRLLDNARRPEARPLVAIYVNGLLFGAVHSLWPAPIPLTVLGMALAWLAYRTQSLVGPVLVHSLFNGVTFLTLVWQQPG